MGSTKWTEDQLKAITTRECNLLVAAAAGSGKTAVLVERIIRIITNEDNPIDIDKLLVVTFTSAAAAEMRERIADAISKALEVNPNSKVLQRQLTLLSRANITTMHSFCLDVIKNYYHIIDLDPTFRIADETENTLLKLEVINDMFEDYYENEDEEFKNLIEAYSTSKDDEKLKNIILDLYRFSMSGPWPEKWLKDSAESFNVATIQDLDKTEWIKVLKETIFTKQAVNTVNEAMRQVIRDPSGTGHAANIEGVDLRGKTGTAEIKQSQTDTKGTEIGWFVTIMPATNNREALELVSMTENVKKRGGSGYVVNKTKKIMEEYLQ